MIAPLADRRSSKDTCYLSVSLLDLFLLKNFSLEMTGKVWESQSKARIIHYESKQKKTGYSESLPHPHQEVWRKGPHVTNFSVAWILVFCYKTAWGLSGQNSLLYFQYNLSWISVSLVFTCQFSLSKHSYHYVEFSFSEKIKWEKFHKVLDLIWLFYLCPLEEELHGLSASTESWSWV